MPNLTKNTAIFSTAALLLAFQWFAGHHAARKNSQTYDEAAHLAAGYSYYATGSFEMNGIDHPPIAKLVAAFPLLFMKPDFPPATHPWRADIQGNQYRIGDFFLYKNRLSADRLLGAGRSAMLLFASLFSLAFFMCVKKIYGSAAGLAALAFWVMYPPATGNSFLITTDYAAMAFFFLAAFFFREALRETSPMIWSAAAGAATGAALASKFSTVTLPAAIVVATVYALNRGEISGKDALKKASIALAAGAAVVWASYFFGNPALFFRGLEYTLTSAATRPRASFLFGNPSVGGWWYYFPSVFLLKTPLTMIISAAMIFLAAKNHYGDGEKKIPAPRGPGIFYLALPPLVFFVAACFSKIQIGHRHILPVYPFIVMWAGAGAAALFRKNTAAKIIAAVVVAVVGAEFAATHPWHISYFSYAVGGAAQGHKYLLDSNVDWGQGIGDLSVFLKKRGVSEIYFSYFGSADPEYYGIGYFPVGFVSTVEREGKPVDLAAQPQKYLAVSATNLFAVYYADKDIFRQLRDIAPVYAAAHSIFVYDLTDASVNLCLSELLDKIGARAESSKVKALRRKD